ncbi:MAG: restriction endonuclease [Sulfurimonas sp.]|nr:restriction endonuclease [Sulfurimonas sp.]
MQIFFIVVIFLMIFAFILMVKYIEKNLPKKLKREKKSWKEDINKKERLKKEYYENLKKIKEAEFTIKQDKNKIKGDSYEKFVANHFKELGYYVWEHGKEKGKLDGGIDLFIKKGNEVYFVQCKNWENWKINHDTVQAVQTKVRNYMKENPNLTKLLNGNDKKILYVMPKASLTKSAYAYIKTHSEILDFKIIPMNKENFKG